MRLRCKDRNTTSDHDQLDQLGQREQQHDEPADPNVPKVDGLGLEAGPARHRQNHTSGEGHSSVGRDYVSQRPGAPEHSGNEKQKKPTGSQMRKGAGRSEVGARHV